MIQRHSRAAGLAAWMFIACSRAWAGGDFAIAPLRVDLGPGARSAAITVTNEGKERLNFQLDAKEWTQDAAGKDQYAETSELIFFPRLMSVEPGQEGIVRVGVKAAPAATEKSYRLFIEELPGLQRRPEGNGAVVNVLIRFGVPIFAAPIQPQDALAIESVEVKNGVVAVTARNAGNRRQVIQGVHLKGADRAGASVYGLDIADRQLLAGAARTYTASIPPEQCQNIAVLSIEVKTDKLSETRSLDVTRAMCPGR